MPTKDEFLASRIRSAMQLMQGFSEKKMFGGFGFFIDGNMCVAAWDSSLIVRLSRDGHEETMREPHVRPMDLTGRIMKGWAIVEPDGIESEHDFMMWLGRAIAFSKTLPAKPAK